MKIVNRSLALFTFCAAAAFAQTPTITAVVNEASFGPPLCPGLLALVYGANFGTNAANLSVSVGGKAAYLYTAAVSAAQLLVQIPFEASLGASTVTVTVAGVSSTPFAITLVATSPAISTQNASGLGLATVQAASGAIATLTNPAHPGDTLAFYAVGLGPTNPATTTGLATASNPTATLPAVTVGGAAATVISAALFKGNAGLYQVSFTVPSTGVQGTEPLVVSIGGQSSSSAVSIALAGTSSVVNNASFALPGTASPGSIASVFANGLVGATTNETSGLFPSTLSEGVQVTFNGEPAPLFHLEPGASPQQIDLLVPSDLPTSGTVNVQLTTSTGSYANYILSMAPSNPGFYRITGTNNVIAQFANTAWLALPASTATSLGVSACTATTNVLVQCGQPATSGDYLVLYLTGLGLATPNGSPSGKPLPTGQNPPSDGSILYETPTSPAVTIGGITAPVLFSGLVPGFAGEYQVDVQVPAGVPNGDAIPIVITMLGASDKTATISIQPNSVLPVGQ